MNYPEDIGNYTNDPRHPDYEDPPEAAEEEHLEAELERDLERMRNNER